MRVALVLCLVLFTSNLAAGQDSTLALNQPVEREVAVGSSHSYTIALDA